MTKEVEEKLKIQYSEKQPLQGLTPDEMKDVITCFIYLTKYPYSIVNNEELEEFW